MEEGEAVDGPGGHTQDESGHAVVDGCVCIPSIRETEMRTLNITLIGRTSTTIGLCLTASYMVGCIGTTLLEGTTEILNYISDLKSFIGP